LEFFVVCILDSHTTRPMPEFVDALEFYQNELQQFIRVYTNDADYYLATLLAPKYGPEFFKSLSEGNLFILYELVKVTRTNVKSSNKVYFSRICKINLLHLLNSFTCLTQTPWTTMLTIHHIS